jgi:hypothetical protein
MILPVAKRSGSGTDIPLCSVPLSLTWLLTECHGTPAAGPPKRGGDLAHVSGSSSEEENSVVATDRPTGRSGSLQA